LACGLIHRLTVGRPLKQFKYRLLDKPNVGRMPSTAVKLTKELAQ
jgi:hypothetical protein